jgi:hypothetical protein
MPPRLMRLKRVPSPLNVGPAIGARSASGGLQRSFNQVTDVCPCRCTRDN